MSDATMTLLLGPELEPLMVAKRLIAQRSLFAEGGQPIAILKIPERNPVFMRLVVQFWQEGARTTASAFTEFSCTFATFAESFAPGIEDLWDSAALSCPDTQSRPAAELVPQLNAAHARHLDQTCALRRSRLQLILRGEYLDFSPEEPTVPPAEGELPDRRQPPMQWMATAAEAAVVNEVRVRCVGHADDAAAAADDDDEAAFSAEAPDACSRLGVEAQHAMGHARGVPLRSARPDRLSRPPPFARHGCFFVPAGGTDAETPVRAHPRLVPAFSVWGRRGGDAWRWICGSGPTAGDDLEVRVFALSNVPRRARAGAALEASFCAMPEAVLWAELDALADLDLTLWLARGVVARKSKLKNFLLFPRPPRPGAAEAAPAAPAAPAPAAPGPGGGAEEAGGEAAGVEPVEPVRLKQWPGKDALQALAVWWMAATLCEGHRYTEPELYAVISSLCAMQPDHGVLRKEMVRRGYLHPPEIVLNANKTTSTYYTVNPEGLQALSSEWRSNVAVLN